MVSAQLTSKGQITVPAAVRRDLQLSSGSRVEFIRLPTGGYEMRPLTGSIRDLRGSVPKPPSPVSLADMDEAIAAGAAESVGRP